MFSVGSSLLCPVLMSPDYGRRPHRWIDCAYWGSFKYTHAVLTWKPSSGRNTSLNGDIRSSRDGRRHIPLSQFCRDIRSSRDGRRRHTLLSQFLFGWLMTRPWKDEAVYACHLSAVSRNAAPTFKWLATRLNGASRACNLVKVSFQHSILPIFLLQSQPPPEADLCSKGIFIRILTFVHQLVLWQVLALELFLWFLKPSLVISKA